MSFKRSYQPPKGKKSPPLVRENSLQLFSGSQRVNTFLRIREKETFTRGVPFSGQKKEAFSPLSHRKGSPVFGVKSPYLLLVGREKITTFIRGRGEEKGELSIPQKLV